MIRREDRDRKSRGPGLALRYFSAMAESSVTFLVLVNPKSGGQDGPQLLERFRELFREESLKGEVVSLTDPLPSGEGVVGPKPSLTKYSNNQNLRLLGNTS